MNSLNGKVVVVTGAGRGLGAAFALSLADAGCELVLCGRRQSDLQEVADLIMQRGGKRADIVTLNLADTSSVNEAASNIAALKSQVDIVINNGAMWLESSIEPYAESDVLAVVNAAITGTYLFCAGTSPPYANVTDARYRDDRFDQRLAKCSVAVRICALLCGQTWTSGTRRGAQADLHWQ